jgi:hypothetical protein
VAVTEYYFHGETRCETCLAIEAGTERLVRDQFAPEIAAGTAPARYSIASNPSKSGSA